MQNLHPSSSLKMNKKLKQTQISHAYFSHQFTPKSTEMEEERLKLYLQTNAKKLSE